MERTCGGGRRNRIDPHGGEIERLAIHTAALPRRGSPPWGKWACQPCKVQYQHSVLYCLSMFHGITHTVLVSTHQLVERFNRRQWLRAGRCLHAMDTRLRGVPGAAARRVGDGDGAPHTSIGVHRGRGREESSRHRGQRRADSDAAGPRRHTGPARCSVAPE